VAVEAVELAVAVAGREALQGARGDLADLGGRVVVVVVGALDAGGEVEGEVGVVVGGLEEVREGVVVHVGEVGGGGGEEADDGWGPGVAAGEVVGGHYGGGGDESRLPAREWINDRLLRPSGRFRAHNVGAVEVLSVVLSVWNPRALTKKKYRRNGHKRANRSEGRMRRRCRNLLISSVCDA